MSLYDGFLNSTPPFLNAGLNRELSSEKFYMHHILIILLILNLPLMSVNNLEFESDK